MKAELFVVAFCVLCAGAYFTYARHKGGMNHDSSIVISNGNFYEEITYSGKINFNEDETAIKSISPGGYFKYLKNDEKIIARANGQGIISYELTDNETKLPLDSNGKKFVTEAIKEMISWGMDAKERMERIYKKGGNPALMNELGNLKNDNVKRQYLEHIFQSDSLSANDLTELAKKIVSSLGSDEDKASILKRFKAVQLTDTATLYAYLQAVENLGAGYAKVNVLKNVLVLPLTKETFPKLFHAISGLGDDNEKATLLKDIIEKRQMDSTRADLLLEAIGHLGPDMEKENLLLQWINKGTIPADRLDKVLELVSHLGSDMDKENLYRRLMRESIKTEEQWIILINEVAQIGPDDQKADLLQQVAQKMPKTDNLKTVYLKTAKTINADHEYGKAVRAVE